MTGIVAGVHPCVNLCFMLHKFLDWSSDRQMCGGISVNVGEHAVRACCSSIKAVITVITKMKVQRICFSDIDGTIMHQKPSAKVVETTRPFTAFIWNVLFLMQFNYHRFAEFRVSMLAPLRLWKNCRFTLSCIGCPLFSCHEHLPISKKERGDCEV